MVSKRSSEISRMEEKETNKIGRWNQHEPGEDPHSVEAKEDDEYWLCSCGLARRSVSTMSDHCRSKGHDAELVDQDENSIMSVRCHT